MEQPRRSSPFERGAAQHTVSPFLDVSEEQSRKAQLPMLVRLAGSWIDVNEEQPSKAQSPRLVRLAGSWIDVNDVQRAKVPV